MRGASKTSGSTLARDAAVVSFIAVLGVMLALQGWRSRVPIADGIPYIDASHALLEHGQLPDHGVVTSFASYAPPGLAWIVLPGVWLFSDLRLFDVPGNALLHLGTLIGIFLLARACIGARCALLAVLIYGVSERGLVFAAGSYLPRGHPFFYVWMTYWTCWWVARKEGKYLAAALLTWLAGMYVFMEVAPALFILPVVWIFHRPPVCFRALAVAGVLGLLIWYPYFRFEATRGFADIRSQLLLERIGPADFADAWCPSTATLREWKGPPIERPPASTFRPTGRLASFAIGSGLRLLAIVRGLIINFEGLIPGVALLLFPLTVFGMLALSVGRNGDPERRDAAAHASSPRPWLAALAITLLVGAGLGNEVVIGRLLSRVPAPFQVSAIRTLQAMAALGGIALLMRGSLARACVKLASELKSMPCDSRVLAIALVVPWIVLLLITEWQRDERFVGLWPLQAIVLAFVVGTVSARAGGIGRWSGPVLITAVMLANPFLASQIDGWRRDGWSGRDAVEIRVADYLASLIRAEGKDRAVIGRRLFDHRPPDPPWKPVNERWRDGEKFDVILEYRHGISNLNQCGESLSAEDEYRIVEAYPPQADAKYYVDVPPAGPLRFLDRIGPYDVYKTERSR